MRKAAGILTILGGLIGGTLLITILRELHVYGLLTTIPLVVAGVGGTCTLKRVNYNWALAGAICSIFFPLFGIPALILLIKSKGDFFSGETAIQGDERNEYLSYYEEEKKLRLLYERVEQLFDKRLGKYENVYFKARKGQPCPEWNWIEDGGIMSIMEKIFEVREYFPHAASEIVKRKKEMSPAPSAALPMSSAWEAAYLDYEAHLDPSNIMASSNPVMHTIQQQRAKELSTNLKKSLQKAWKEEREFRKHLKISSSEYQRIVDDATRAVASDEWLQKLEAECP